MISVMMIKEDIEDIIWRDYQGICSEEEKLSLQEWIEASEKNRLVFEPVSYTHLTLPTKLEV